ncbi:MAG: hypothetical protein ABR956_06750 [Terracidiphilus sp.]
MRNLSFLTFFALICVAGASATAEDCGALPAAAAPGSHVMLTAASHVAAPVLTVRSKGAEEVVGGFEGGTVIKADGAFYAFVTEMMAGWSTRLALWSSPDGDHWTRIATLFSSSGDFTGKDRRAGLWAAMPVYDEQRGEWDLFYVAYRAKPDTPTAWYANYDGEIVRAVSQTRGKDGFKGPYADAGVILSPGRKSDAWEGLQGVDSFYPYRVGDEWMGFYGTAHTEVKPVSSWRVGLAAAPALRGPWRRCSQLNPSPIETHFIENPVVSRVGDSYLAVYDVDVDAGNSIGYADSQDGVNWSQGRRLEIFTDPSFHARTPLALIDDGHGAYDLFVTAYAPVKNAQGKTVSKGALFHLKVKAR